MNDEVDYTLSSGNVFADLGITNPDEADTKAELAIQINRVIGRRGLTQVQAAKVLGISQPKVSALMRGHLTGFSIERLLRFLAALGSDVQIVVTTRDSASGTGHIRVLAQ
jgi:predicted XRE-type DNA-binding protein